MIILIAESDSDYNAIFDRLKESCQIIKTDNGQNSIDSYVMNFPVVCIIDENITKPDSLEVCNKIKEISQEFNKKSYIIMTTPSDLTKEFIKATESGVDQFLKKPYDSSDLKEAVEQALNRLGIVEVDLSGFGHPVKALIDEHQLLDELLDLMEVFYQNLDEKTPLEVIEWFSSTSFLLTLEVHEEKERYLVNSMIDTFLMKDEELFHEFATKHLIRVQDDHIQMFEILGKLKDSINSYISEYVEIMDEEPDTIDTAYLGPIKKNFKRFNILMMGHIKMEEEIMFPFIMKHMTKGDIIEISQCFKDVHENVGSKKIIKSIEEITSLKDVILDSFLD